MNQMLKDQCALQIGQSSCYFAMQIWLRGRLDEWNRWERKWIVPKRMRSQDQNLYAAQMENDAAMACYCIPKTCSETVFFTKSQTESDCYQDAVLTDNSIAPVARNYATCCAMFCALLRNCRLGCSSRSSRCVPPLLELSCQQWLWSLAPKFDIAKSEHL